MAKQLKANNENPVSYQVYNVSIYTACRADNVITNYMKLRLCYISKLWVYVYIYILFWYCVYSTQSHYYWPKKRELNEVHDYNSLLSIRSIISTKRIVSINGNNIRTMTIPNAVLHFIEYALLYSSGVKWSDRRVRSVVISLQYFYRKKKSAFFNRTKIAIKIREKWKLIIDWNLI